MSAVGTSGGSTGTSGGGAQGRESGGGGEVRLAAMSDLQREQVQTTISFFNSYYQRLDDYLEGRVERRLALDARKATMAPRQADQEESRFAATESALVRAQRVRHHLHSFKFINKIGKGGYGDVFLVSLRDSDAVSPELLALKVMKKELVVDNEREMAHLQTERNVLASMSSPWLVNLLHSFQDIEHVFLAMEFVGGGDFRSFLQLQGRLNEDWTCFYAAEMFSAVNALHTVGYIHRDLKPENFLIEAYTGHLKLTDFGLAKGSMRTAMNSGTLKRNGRGIRKTSRPRQISKSQKYFQTLRSRKGGKMQRTFSLVGSPEYIAVEMLEESGYDFSVDYWALACVIFEMIIGFSPFADENPTAVLTNILDYDETLDFPDIENYMSISAWACIRGILSAPRDRLGANGFHEIKDHAFFAAIDWDHLREETPPVVPSLESETDTRYFAEYEADADDPIVRVLMAPTVEEAFAINRDLRGLERVVILDEDDEADADDASRAVHEVDCQTVDDVGDADEARFVAATTTTAAASASAADGSSGAPAVPVRRRRELTKRQQQRRVHGFSFHRMDIKVETLIQDDLGALEKIGQKAMYWALKTALLLAQKANLEWTLVHCFDDSTAVYIQPDPDTQRHTVAAKNTVNAPATAVAAFLEDANNRAVFDDRVESISQKMVLSTSEHAGARLVQIVYAPTDDTDADDESRDVGASSVDFSVVQSYKTNPITGKFSWGETSVECALIPPSRLRARGIILRCGLCVLPLDESTCDLVFATQVPSGDMSVSQMGSIRSLGFVGAIKAAIES